MRKIVRLKNNSYHSAKISVLRGHLYGQEQLENFAQMSFDEILKFMEENNFKEEIDKSYFKYEGFYLIEKILNNYLSNIYKKVFLSATKENRKLFDAYYLKYQIHNLMVLVRCKIANEKEIEAYLIGDARKISKFLKA